MEIVIHNFDRLPIKVHGITRKSPLGFEKINFRNDSISWDLYKSQHTIYIYIYLYLYI